MMACVPTLTNVTLETIANATAFADSHRGLLQHIRTSNRSSESNTQVLNDRNSSILSVPLPSPFAVLVEDTKQEMSPGYVGARNL